MEQFLSRRVKTRRMIIVSLCTLMLVSITTIAIHHIRNMANAATQDGERVQLQYDSGSGVNYGGSGSNEASTHFFKINGKDAYCAIPDLTAPSQGPYRATALADSDVRNRIILAAYIYEHRNDDDAATYWMNHFYGDQDDEKRYGWTHSVIGYLYTSQSGEPQYGTLQSGSQDYVQRIAGTIANIIQNGESVWTERASKYRLYELNTSDIAGNQNIVWIEKKDEPAPEYGSIIVTKKDATTHGTAPQGNATFNGIKFTAKLNGVEERSCTLARDSSSCTIGNLEYGTYTISESQGSNTDYQVNVNSSEPVVRISHDASEANVSFENEVKKGSIKVRKKDSKMQDGECKTTSGHSFNGITFGLYLDKTTSNKIKYGDNEYDPKSGQNEILIATKTIGEEGCDVMFRDLPIANYYIKEILANSDYILSNEIKDADITATNNTIEVVFSNAPTSLGTVATDKNDGDHYVEARSDATIVDKVGYCVETGKHYMIKGVLMDKSTGEELLIDGKRIESSADINPTTSCGSASMEFVIDARELGGKDVVVFEKLYKYKENGNYENEDLIVRHENINDSKQTITIISLDTEAKDGIDDDKQILADKTAIVKDTVSYCVKPGQKYTIRGILMDKSTGEPLLVNGEKIEGAVEIEPTEACGTAEMLFHFDATGMEGKEVVVFEKLFIFDEEISDDDNPIITHEDINDEDQAVFIYLPPPDTGRFSSQNGSTSINGFIIVPAIIGVVVSGYEFRRVTAKRRFLRNK